MKRRKKMILMVFWIVCIMANGILTDSAIQSVSQHSWCDDLSFNPHFCFDAGTATFTTTNVGERKRR